MSRILVTGGSGFIGNRVAEKLAGSCHEVVILSRTKNRLRESLGKISFRTGDVTDADSLKGSAEEIDIVIHLAGKMEDWNTTPAELYKVNFTGTKNLILEALKEKVKHFVFCSAPGVCGIGKNYPVTEEEEYSARGAYEGSKIRAEEFLIKTSKESRLPLTIVRPDFVYGPGDRQKLPLFNTIMKSMAFIPGKGEAVFLPTYIDDAAEGIVLASLMKQNGVSIYNIGGPEGVSVKVLFETIAKNLRRRVFKTPLIPYSLFYLMAYSLEKISGLLKTAPLLTRRRLMFFTKSHYTNIEKAKRELGYYPKTGIEAGIKETIAWYMNEGWL